MKKCREVFVGIDTAKARNAVAVAEGGRGGEVVYLGEFDASPTAVIKLVRKLKEHHQELHFCYEAGPTGHGLYRQIIALGHDCMVVAPKRVSPGSRSAFARCRKSGGRHAARAVSPISHGNQTGCFMKSAP
jgi:transposase